MEMVSSWHIGVAAEAFAAAQFARYGYYVSVQYGANQPEYDLIAQTGDKMLKVSVKGSKDGGWGLTQKYKKGNSYHEAIDLWFASHGKKTIFCLVQFDNTTDDELPRIYVAAPYEIAEVMKNSANGRGDTILYEYHKWGAKASGSGTIDKVPDNWKMTRERIAEMFETYG